jgi:hypothetical protein
VVWALASKSAETAGDDGFFFATSVCSVFGVHCAQLFVQWQYLEYRQTDRQTRAEVSFLVGAVARGKLWRRLQHVRRNISELLRMNRRTAEPALVQQTANISISVSISITFHFSVMAGGGRA